MKTKRDENLSGVASGADYARDAALFLGGCILAGGTADEDSQGEIRNPAGAGASGRLVKEEKAENYKIGYT